MTVVTSGTQEHEDTARVRGKTKVKKGGTTTAMRPMPLISRTVFCLFQLSHSLLSPSPPGRAYMPLVNGQGIADQSRVGVPGLLVLSQNQQISVEHVWCGHEDVLLPFSTISPTNTFAKPATI